MSIENSSSISEQLLSRLKKIESLLTTSNRDEKQVWMQFLPIWCDILQYPSSTVTLCYTEAGEILTNIIESNDFDTITDDESLSAGNFLTCLSLLNHSHFKSYLKLSDKEQMMSSNEVYFTHISGILSILSNTVCSGTVFDLVDIQKQLENFDDLFIVLIDHVDRSLLEYSKATIEDENVSGDINDNILSIIWNGTDQTMLVPFFLRCGLTKKLVNWFSECAKLTPGIRESLINIIHNVSRHDNGVDELNKYDLVKKIKEYQEFEREIADSRSLVASMALALLSTPEQLKKDKKGMNGVLNQLLQLVMDAAQGSDFRNVDRFHVSEPLAVLVKMFVVEERTLDYVLCHAETEPSSDMHSTIKLFASLLSSFSQALKGTGRREQFTLIALLNIFWSISFQPLYRQELIKTENLTQTIKTFIAENYEQKVLEQYKPRSMEGIKEAALGIFHNLDLNNQTEPKIDQHLHAIEGLVPGPIVPTNVKPTIMISYCHSNNSYCDQILNFLTKRSDAFEIWIDRTHCQSAGDLWEAIADGMERSSVIVPLVSNEYFESKSCRKEFTYACDTLKKTVVPVLLQEFQPRGWLGIRMPDMKYVRLRTSHIEEKKMSELLNTILVSISVPTSSQREKPSVASHQALVSSSNVAVTERPSTLRPFHEWGSNGDDVAAWFLSHRISRKIQDLFEFEAGEEMLDYAELFIKDREKQTSAYAKIYSEKYNGSEMPPHEFNRFTVALEKLLKENRPSSFSMAKTSSVSHKSSVCTIL